MCAVLCCLRTNQIKNNFFITEIKKLFNLIGQGVQNVGMPRFLSTDIRKEVH